MFQSHLPPLSNFDNFVHPTFACFSEETLKASGPFYMVSYSVYVRGSKRSHAGGKCVTCSELTNSREGQLTPVLAQAVWKKPPET